MSIVFGASFIALPLLLAVCGSGTTGSGTPTSNALRQFQIGGTVVNAAAEGIAVRKGDASLLGAIQAAFTAVKSDGTSNDCFAQWQLNAAQKIGGSSHTCQSFQLPPYRYGRGLFSRSASERTNSLVQPEGGHPRAFLVPARFRWSGSRRPSRRVRAWRAVRGVPETDPPGQSPSRYRAPLR